ncbi:MAG: DUF680 domain-containing protein [Mesorhizobium sp.]|uniref:DUF680 domain-containing protein n=1 Tax=Mesorhizobium sp. TaxID=1871066 RepID=UPI00121C40EA|nr:DUF680 domain-containing protein [Mesorhizobium sp.]TIS55573.1 MAG: DUF680 domain-containing protein [Mesorhizobium sp.]TIS87869.1 MAG: DUF680 domain-containing protein [Mesorhizobium sp.]TJW06445.1 MAG: DUF680 domain-containing protein [Mesorhizobium sp.]TJW41722.1 MAG: DUF680 domain-containing protein [Mesorhizobium sp.]
MTKIALTAAAFLLATGTAFAASDHYGSDGVNQPAAPVGPATSVGNVDNTFTGSISRLVTTGQHSAVNPRVETQYGTSAVPGATQSGPAESGQGIWGR